MKYLLVSFLIFTILLLTIKIYTAASVKKTTPPSKVQSFQILASNLKSSPTPSRLPPSPTPSPYQKAQKPTTSPKALSPTPSVSQPTNPPKSNSLHPDMRSEVLTLLNKRRQNQGLPVLLENSLLDNSALNKASDLVNKNYWSHTSPDGKEFWVFLNQVGYSYLDAGENLARGYFDASSVVDSWMQSESHRLNILNRNYKEMGIAILDTLFQGERTRLVILHFGSRAS